MLQLYFLLLGFSHLKFLILKCFAWKHFAEFSKAALGRSSLCVLYDAGLGLQQGLHITKGLVFRDHAASCFVL